MPFAVHPAGCKTDLPQIAARAASRSGVDAGHGERAAPTLLEVTSELAPGTSIVERCSKVGRVVTHRLTRFTSPDKSTRECLGAGNATGEAYFPLDQIRRTPIRRTQSDGESPTKARETFVVSGSSIDCNWIAGN